MTEFTRYRCDICGAVYASKEECEKCEGNHKKPKFISRMRYGSPLSCHTDGYPDSVVIQFEDDSLITYDRREIVD